LLALVAADVARTAMMIVAGFTPKLLWPAVVIGLLAILAFRGLGWARWLLVGLVAIRLIMVLSWLAGTLVGLHIVGILITVGLAAAYGFALYALVLSGEGRAYFERRRLERQPG